MVLYSKNGLLSLIKDGVLSPSFALALVASRERHRPFRVIAGIYSQSGATNILGAKYIRGLPRTRCKRRVVNDLQLPPPPFLKYPGGALVSVPTMNTGSIYIRWYQVVSDNTAKTNHVSEGWHKRLRVESARCDLVSILLLVNFYKSNVIISRCWSDLID